jgi:hypothetical protein
MDSASFVPSLALYDAFVNAFTISLVGVQIDDATDILRFTPFAETD